MRSLELKDLEELGPKRFQELVAALVMVDHPEAEQLAGADGGADVLLERSDHRPRAWQVKHFPRRIRWDQCRDSLDAVVESYDPDEVVFVFPRDLGKQAKQTFKSTLRSRHPGVEVSYISGSQVLDRVRRVREGLLAEEFFGPDPRDQAKAIAEHLESRGLRLTPGRERDPIVEDLTLASEAGRRDRQYRTEVSLSTGDTPEPSWAEPPSMVLTGRKRDQTLRISVWPERPDDRPGPSINFPDAAVREREIEEIRRQFALHGEARVPKEATVRTGDVPEAISALGGTGAIYDATLKAEMAHQTELTGEFDGVRLSRSLVLYTMPPFDRDGVYEFGRIDRGLRLFVSFEMRESETHESEMEIGFALNLAVAGGGVELEDALEAARLLVAVDEGTASLSVPSLYPDGPMKLPEIADAQRRLEHRAGVDLFKNLILIRDALGVTFELEPSVVTAEDMEAVDILAEGIETGRGQYIVDNVTGHLAPDQLDRWREPSKDPLIARFPATAKVFGETVEFGIAEAELPPPDSTRVLDAPVGAEEGVELLWDDECVVEFEIVRRPTDPPTRLGIWSPDELPPLDA